MRKDICQGTFYSIRVQAQQGVNLVLSPPTLFLLVTDCFLYFARSANFELMWQNNIYCVNVHFNHLAFLHIINFGCKLCGRWDKLGKHILPLFPHFRKPNWKLGKWAGRGEGGLRRRRTNVWFRLRCPGATSLRSWLNSLPLVEHWDNFFSPSSNTSDIWLDSDTYIWSP